MRLAFATVVVSALVQLGAAAAGWAQSGLGSLEGKVTDATGAARPGTRVTVRNLDTNLARTVVADADGRYRASHLPMGRYEVTAEQPGFARYVHSGIILAVEQAAVVDVVLLPRSYEDEVTVEGNAPLLETTHNEIGVRFDHKRVTELPISPDRNVYGLALSAPGIVQTGNGQTTTTIGGASTALFAQTFSTNGMRVRSNNFMVDGQDVNDTYVTGIEQAINNPDLVQEVRVITHQPGAQYGRNSGAVLNVITRSGTNEFHGTAFWFENRCGEKGEETGGVCMNARTNSDERADQALGRDRDPYRREHQFGGTIGGPIRRDQTFFFASYQRWTNDEFATGRTLSQVPTEDGRRVLEAAAGAEPQVRALLDFLPAAQVPNGQTVRFVRNGTAYLVPLGELTSEGPVFYGNHQGTLRLDHNFSPRHAAGARYVISSTEQTGQDQITPPRHGSTRPTRQQSVLGWLTSILSPSLVNEVRAGLQSFDSRNEGEDPAAASIPNFEVAELGLTGTTAGFGRTALGLSSTLPVIREHDNFQVQDTLSWTSGRHSWKLGADVRRNGLDLFLIPFLRGAVRYATVQGLVDDVAESAQVARIPTGADEIQHFRWWDIYTFLQDDWRVSDSLTLALGLRYELPGNALASFYPISDAIVAARDGDQRYALDPQPSRDTNNLEPRLGFNWHPTVEDSGLLGALTGRDRLVVRGGYARTHDYAHVNQHANVYGAFPFVSLVTLQGVSGVGVRDAWDRLATAQPVGDPLMQTRSVLAEDFRSPASDQFSLEVQRQLGADFAVRVGYVGTRGHDLFQTLDGNPRLPFLNVRTDPMRGVIRVRANTGESTYDSLQVSVEKRLSHGVSGAVHYTLSRYVDTTSDVYNLSNNDVALPQDAYDIGADRARSAYDRPQRLTGNVIVDLPFHEEQEGLAGKLLGGWRISANFNFQDGAPFTVLNGADPTGALAGISTLGGNAIRPNLSTDLDLGDMTVQEVLDAGGARLFRPLCGNPSPTCVGERVGNAPRNLLRSDGVANLDLGFIKSTPVGGDKQVQLWLQLFNATNTRNFGIPNGNITSGADFLNEKNTNGGARRIVAALRFVF
jgi:hypothetical protein